MLGEFQKQPSNFQESTCLGLENYLIRTKKLPGTFWDSIL